MAKKKAEPGRQLGTRAAVALSIAGVLAFAVLGFVVGGIVYLFVRGGDTNGAEPLPAFASDSPPPIERSAAADVLESKTLADMTEEERALVKSEVVRVLRDGEFRASSASIPGIDVFRRDGVTRAVRQYEFFEPPGGGVALSQKTIYYCDAPDGSLISYRYIVTPLTQTAPRLEALDKDAQPFQGPLASFDLAQASDLGFDEIGGRRVHGLDVIAVYNNKTFGYLLWIDVENARVLRFSDRAVPESGYTFDWRPPQPVTWSPLGDQPPCAALLES